NLKKLTKLEEKVIVNYIFNLNLRRFTPMYATIRDIANKLLASRGATLYKDIVKLIKQKNAKYSIYNKDVYNFNKASFIIGRITT
ncbi:hypothetical protein COCSADRAFT_67058, partial [Bipolaris sorokiniana ND90Pr]